MGHLGVDMKKKLISLFSVLLVCALFLFAVACGSDHSQEEEQPTVILRLDKSALSLNLYESYEFRVQYTGAKELIWTSSDEKVIRLDGKKAEAIGTGTSVIRVAAGDETAECTIVVADNGLVPYITVNLPENRCTLVVGDDYTLIPCINFNGSTYPNGDFKFTATGEAVSVGSGGVVKAVIHGTAELTITANWRDFGPEYLKINILFEVVQ